MTYLDTRDLLEERDELADRDNLDRAEDNRLAALNALVYEIGAQTMSDADCGPLIPKDEFTDYAQALAEDIGAIERNAAWPAYHIDWEAAAADLAQDYMEVEFDGTTYYYRAS